MPRSRCFACRARSAQWQCAACHTSLYCSRACQQTNWAMHAQVCTLLLAAGDKRKRDASPSPSNSSDDEEEAGTTDDDEPARKVPRVALAPPDAGVHKRGRDPADPDVIRRRGANIGPAAWKRRHDVEDAPRKAPRPHRGGDTVWPVSVEMLAKEEARVIPLLPRMHPEEAAAMRAMLPSITIQNMQHGRALVELRLLWAALFARDVLQPVAALDREGIPVHEALQARPEIARSGSATQQGYVDAVNVAARGMIQFMQRDRRVDATFTLVDAHGDWVGTFRPERGEWVMTQEVPRAEYNTYGRWPGLREALLALHSGEDDVLVPLMQLLRQLHLMIRPRLRLLNAGTGEEVSLAYTGALPRVTQFI